MPLHPMDNTSWASPVGNGVSGNRSIGNRFAVNTPCNVTGMRWYRHKSGEQLLQGIRLWKAGVTSGPVVSAPSIPNSGTIGWQDVALTTPFPLEVGVTYIIYGELPSVAIFATLNRPGVNPPPSGVLWDDFISCSHQGGYQYPDVVTDTIAWGLDVTLDLATGPPPEPPATPTDVDNNLAAWLSTDANTHTTNGIPWLDYQVDQDTQAAVKGTGSYTTLGVFPRLNQILAAIASLVTIVTNVLSWFGGIGKPSDHDDVPTELDQIRNTVGDTHTSVETLLARPPGGQWADGQVLSPAAHTLVDSFPFTGQVGWGSGYALHRIHIDTSDDRHPMIDIGAAGWWVPGVGWWAPTLPDGALGRRTVLEFADQWLWPVPSAATGLIVWVHPSVTGTLYAYSVP